MSNSRPDANDTAAWLDWAQVDVFADAPYQGNMLAVFPDATGLTDAEMQAIARETNLSETTFVFPRDRAVEEQQGIRVRIFTTQEELPFAGHPTLGTASWLRAIRPELADAEKIILHLNVGPVLVRFPQSHSSDPAAAITAEMEQPEPIFLDTIGPGDLHRDLGLDTLELHPHLPPQIVSTGLPVLVVPLASFEALAALEPDPAREKTLRSATSAKFVYFLAQHDEHTWHARLPLYGGEDPATGSAAGCAISYLVEHGAAPPETAVTILQGRFVHRPSRILVQAALDTGRVCRVRVRGCTIPVATGRFLRP
ncbi:PhzF family phenazine biosynthesis protein [Terriglobus aquaticus]|uniref:PhzF family phenazine biosynthesis protein n=1 Tax=Terriglobus aquaticus TaxID=940139 RepID=A0ABW9KHR9_9BACT|nr:PhzF family phenazine biosynthesis protein [Terriglobus aquaticus]